jgi:hypothetical protein
MVRKTAKKPANKVVPADFVPDSKNRLDTRYFIDMSVPLTGFNPIDLYGTAMAEDYLRTLVGRVGKTQTHALYQWCDGEKKKPGSTVKLPDGDNYAILRAVARALTKMWYVGAWYGLPTKEYARLEAAGKQQGETIAANEAFMVSPQAYVSGLVWKLGGGHPPGANPTGFGSWEQPPAAIPPVPTGEYEETA